MEALLATRIERRKTSDSFTPETLSNNFPFASSYETKTHSNNGLKDMKRVLRPRFISSHDLRFAGPTNCWVLQHNARLFERYARLGFCLESCPSLDPLGLLHFV
jgi:hypothetical protein